MSNQDPPPPPPPSFDQIVKGDVSIKKLKNKKNMYRITFSKIGKFLVYQVWDKDNTLNRTSRRAVFRESAKKWVNAFIKQNKNLKEKGKELFTPTTIMETGDAEQYAFVIRKAYFDSHDRIVFTISTKEIQLSNNCSKKLIQIPLGKFNNMRFDIDELYSYDYEAYLRYYVNGFPTGLVNNDAGKGPHCWEDNQLSFTQLFDLDTTRYNIGGAIPTEYYNKESFLYNFLRRDDRGVFVYTCRSYI